MRVRARMDGRCVRTVVATAVVAIGAASSSAFAADPVQFSTFSASCDPSWISSASYGSPVAAAHPSVIVRYTVNSGTGTASLDDTYSNRVGVGDVVWSEGKSVAANDSPYVTARCYQAPAPVPYTAWFYDRPTTPTSFSGVGNTQGSVLGFVAPGAAQYVADLTLSGGAVQLRSGDTFRSQSFASSGQLALGTLGAGSRTLEFDALDGPRPAWTVSIRALAVAISNLAFDQTVTRPGAFIQAKYTTSGDTAITAVIRNSAGQSVKTLSSAMNVSGGDHTLAWDGRDDAGNPLPDGAYSLTLDSRDPSGLTGSASATVTIDGTPPDVTMTTPATITADQAVSGQVTDALSGVASADIKDASGYQVLSLKAGQTTFSVTPPSRGWDLGAKKLTVTAADGAGNKRTVDLAFTVAPPKPTTTAGCTKDAATRAVESSAALMRAIRNIGIDFAGKPVLNVYGVHKVLCTDLTGDGVKDMSVLLMCCTVGSPKVFAVFKGAASGSLTLAYKDTRLNVWTFSPRGRNLILKTPHYRRSDANCCPSTYRYYKVAYTKNRFKVTRTGRR